MAGVVRVGGRPQRRPAEPLRAGDRLEARIDAERLLGSRDAPFVLRPDRILYEDAWLIAVDKPAGLSTVATADPRRPHLVAAVEQYLRARGENIRSASTWPRVAGRSWATRVMARRPAGLNIGRYRGSCCTRVCSASRIRRRAAC